VRYNPREDINSYTGKILFYKNKEYEFNEKFTKDEFGAIRQFTDKEIKNLFIKSSIEED
jgi:hypothetical protein